LTARQVFDFIVWHHLQIERTKNHQAKAQKKKKANKDQPPPNHG
jgi:hypothetical protein